VKILSKYNPPARLMQKARGFWQGARSVATAGFTFGRPLIVLQSDDWGRVGVRDAEGFEALRSAGLTLGVRPYDYYTLETAEDVAAITNMLQGHRDCAGGHPCLGMNFVMANVDFARVIQHNFQEIFLRPLSGGLPDDWNRPGLFDAYWEGISAGVLSPGLHATTHFCRQAAQRHLNDPGIRGNLIRTLWQAGVPYIYWRMPWIGYEYSDSRNGKDEFLKSETQEGLVEKAVQMFSEFFATLPRSACAPGYRADRSTHRAWAACGIRVAQDGPGAPTPPHFEESDLGNPLLHLYRSLDFEPIDENGFSLQTCLKQAEECIRRGIPVIVSVHSINFHSTLKKFRTRTLSLLDEFLSGLEWKHPDLLYVRDLDLYDLVNCGKFNSAQFTVPVEVRKHMYAGGVSGGGSS
jgi:hypothetical protein